ncbi:MAG: hypothetical protein R3250_02750 [Melioribacteraceae bacterium]|nr:hypothetical protein [Melioribacteraceae bacterium]
MLREELKLIKAIEEILSNKVFTTVNAVSEEAAESVMECIKLIKQLTDFQNVFDRRTEDSMEFAGQHEDFVKEVIAQFEARHLHAFLFVSDNDCDNNIVAGHMPEKGLASNTIQTLLNIPELIQPVLIGIGMPEGCAKQCDDIHRAFRQMTGKDFPSRFKDMMKKDEDSKEN